MKHRNSRMLLNLGFGRGPARRDGTDDTGGNTDGGGGAGNTDGGKDAGAKTPKIDGDVDPDRVAKTLAAARDGEKKAKQTAADATKAKDDMANQIAVLLGLKPDPKLDPSEAISQVTKDRDKAVAKARASSIELAVHRNAGKAGGDPDALLDSNTFLKKVAEIDPDAADFKDQVVAAVKEAVKANPKLGATVVGGGARMGADMSGGGGSNGERPKSIREAFARKNQ